MQGLKYLLLFFVLLLFCSACGEDEMPPTTTGTDTGKLSLWISLKENYRLPDQYTCKGENKSPALSWTNSYNTTQSYVVICSNGLSGVDREIYWLLSDIAASSSQLNIGAVPSGAVNGPNSFGSMGYAGPCPVEGTGKQNFEIQLFALNKVLGLSSNVSEAGLLAAMEGGILEEASFSTYYSTFTISSNNFEPGGAIPVAHTCNGIHAIPHLQWSGGVSGAAAYALNFFDEDALNFVHWLVTDFSGDRIEEGAIPSGGIQGRNGLGSNSYFGPCPPNGNHRYYFRLYALDEKLNLEEGFTLAEMELAMEGHILDQTDFFGKYEK